MTTDNKALKLEAQLRQQFFDATKRLSSSHSDEYRTFKLGIQTGRDQLQKELAEMEPSGYFDPATNSLIHSSRRCASTALGLGLVALIPQPTMPSKGDQT